MNQKAKGILYILLSAFCFAWMNAFVRMAGDLPSMQKSFFRNFVAAIFAFILLKKNHTPLQWQKGNLRFLLIRSACGTLGILCNYYAIDHLVLSDASMLNKMSPFFAILFSYFFLREKCTSVQVLGVIGAFAGSLFILKPSFTNLDLLPSLVGFVGGMAAGAAYTAVRHLGLRGEKGPFIVFFFSAFSCLVTLPYLVLSYHPMTPVQFGILLLAGLSAAGGQFAITAAYCHAPSKEISVYDYSQIIFSALLGFFFFGQIPDGYSIVGYVIIITIAVLMFLYQNRKKGAIG